MRIDYWHKFEEGGIYHIYNRAVQDTDLFRNTKIDKSDEKEDPQEDYKDFLSKYDKYFGAYFDMYAYCLMPNHFHFLVKVKPLEAVRSAMEKEETIAAIKVIKSGFPINDFLVDQMRRFFSAFALKIKHKYSRRGPLFSKRFKRVIVGSEVKLQYMLCYIHHNPIHHGFTEGYEDWQFSSYNTYLSTGKTKVDKKEILAFMEGLDNFLKIHKAFKIEMGNFLNLD